jgi:hypothetical protein
VSTAAGYDPKIIERFAEQLMRKADTVRVGCAVGGGIFGVFIGAVPLTPLKSVWGVPAGFGVATIIVGALLGILVGYVIGEGRAFRYRVQAQSAIFQLQIERRVASAVTEAVTQSTAAAAPAAEAPAPVSPPVSTPAPPPPPSAPEPAPPLSPLETPLSTPAPPLPPASAETAPPLSPVEPLGAPLLRPPGKAAPQARQPEELPPLSPAANG